MKIAFCGAGAVGKSTLIEQMIQRWPMYKRPSRTYRDIIAEQKLIVNKESTTEVQKNILSALVEEAQLAAASGDEFIVFDRCVVDNIVYSLWHAGYGTEGFDEKFLKESKDIARAALHYYDIIFYVPARDEIPLTERENRDTDPAFRAEIDNIFKALITSYENQTGAFFPQEDSPAVIELLGPPDLRLPQLGLYIKESGRAFGEEDGSLISNINSDEFAAIQKSRTDNKTTFSTTDPSLG